MGGAGWVRARVLTGRAWLSLYVINKGCKNTATTYGRRQCRTPDSKFQKKVIKKKECLGPSKMVFNGCSLSQPAWRFDEKARFRKN